MVEQHTSDIVMRHTYCVQYFIHARPTTLLLTARLSPIPHNRTNGHVSMQCAPFFKNAMYVSTIGVLRYPNNEKRMECVVLCCVVLYRIVCACVWMDEWMERSIAQSGMNERGCAVLCSAVWVSMAYYCVSGAVY